MTTEEIEQLEALLIKARAFICSQHPEGTRPQEHSLDIYVNRGNLIGRVAHINNGSATVYRQSNGFKPECETYY